MPGFNMRPPNIVLASALPLGAAYANIGSAPVSIAGGRDATLHLAETGNVEGASVKFFVSDANVAPTAVANMFQVVAPAGTEIEVAVTLNTAMRYRLNCGGKWLWVQARGAIGANAVLTARKQINYGYDDHLQKFVSASKPFSAAPVAVGASATQIGAVLDIRGLGDITLMVTESAGVTGVISVFLANADTPPVLAAMTAIKDAASAVVTFTTLLNEKAAHYIGNVCADYLAISATGNGSNLLVSLFGTLNGFHG